MKMSIIFLLYFLVNNPIPLTVCNVCINLIIYSEDFLHHCKSEQVYCHGLTGFDDTKEENMVLENVGICTSWRKPCADVILLTNKSPVWTDSLTHLSHKLSTPVTPAAPSSLCLFLKGCWEISKRMFHVLSQLWQKWGRPTANHCTFI